MTNGNDTINFTGISKGLTKREYFAAMAMQGILASNTEGLAVGSIDIDGFAGQSVKAADALIKALNETK